MTIIKTYNLEIIELQIKGLKFMSRRTLGTKSKGPVKPGNWGYGYQIEKDLMIIIGMKKLKYILKRSYLQKNVTLWMIFQK